MAYNIKYNRLGEVTFLENLLYLENNWQESVIINYLNKVDEIIYLIENNPEIFPKWKDQLSIRKVVIVPQITLFYDIEGKTIEILLFWNNYQNPEKLKEFLK